MTVPPAVFVVEIGVAIAGCKRASLDDVFAQDRSNKKCR
jgi:hypothetical protein